MHFLYVTSNFNWIDIHASSIVLKWPDWEKLKKIDFKQVCVCINCNLSLRFYSSIYFEYLRNWGYTCVSFLLVYNACKCNDYRYIFYCKIMFSYTNHRAECRWMICVSLSNMSALFPCLKFYLLYDKKSCLWLQTTLNRIVYILCQLHRCSSAQLQNLRKTKSIKIKKN